MKTCTMLLAAIALCGASTSFAARGDRWIGVQLGGSVPTGDFSRLAKSGFEGGLTGTYFQSDRVGVGLDVAYHEWSGASEATSALQFLGGPSTDLQLRALQTTAHGICELRAAGTARPYLELGFGVYWMKSDVLLQGQAFKGAYTPEFGSLVGLGIDSRTGSRYAVGIAAKYHVIQSGGGNAHLVTVDVHLLGGK